MIVLFQRLNKAMTQLSSQIITSSSLVKQQLLNIYITGRFNETIVQMRKELLEAWLNRLARHPIVGDSLLFSGFLKKHDNTVSFHY